MSLSVEPGLEPRDLDAYAQPHLWRSLLDVATSVVPYLALTALMYLMIGRFGFLTVLLSVPAAGFRIGASVPVTGVSASAAVAS